MRSVKYITIIAAAIMLSGCWMLSVHPLYNDDDVINDPALAGKWYNVEGMDELWIFEETQDDYYRLTIINEDMENELAKAVNDESRLVVSTDPTRDGIFQVHLLELGGQTYLDYYPEEPETGNDFYKSHVIPAHSFARVSIQGNVMSITYFDQEWLKENLDNGGIDIKHERRDNLIVLTAGTDELQKFILKYADEVFKETDQLKKLE